MSNATTQPGNNLLAVSAEELDRVEGGQPSNRDMGMGVAVGLLLVGGPFMAIGGLIGVALLT